MSSPKTEIQQFADRAARGMVREHPEFADPEIFKLSLGWFKFHTKRGYTPKQREEFLSQYRHTFAEVTR